MSTTTISTSSGQRIAFIQATWHRDIVDQARRSFLDEITKLGVAADSVDVFEVPGVFEIPLHAKLLAATGRYRAIVAAGFIVDGGIYRHEFVSTAVIDGLMRVQLDSSVATFSVVLTPQHFHEHEEHRKFFHEHFVIKGREAAHAVVRTLESLAKLR
jgi:6,7-dimethyl-8-ribityllumazine synthase